VQIQSLSLEGCWLITPLLLADERGVFLESFQTSHLADVIGHNFDLKQMNISTSRLGTIRGIHFAQVPPGQAKYVQCFQGRILDIVVDIRIGSPTFGQSEAIELDSQTRQGLYVSEGFGHGFCSLSDDTVVGYLCSQPYAPDREHGIHPFDPAMNLPWPQDVDVLLSTKDAQAPTLAEAEELGILPQYDECLAYLEQLRTS
jgi:dTDP-4-dehydrorhamnose 3,5-epimerase